MRYVLIALLALAACQAPKTITKTVEREVIRRDTVLITQGGKVDTIFRVQELPIDRPVYVDNPEQTARLKLLRNKVNELYAQCEAIPETVLVPRVEYRERIISEESETVYKTDWQKVILLGAILGLIVGVAMYFVARKFRLI